VIVLSIRLGSKTVNATYALKLVISENIILHYIIIKVPNIESNQNSFVEHNEHVSP